MKNLGDGYIRATLKIMLTECKATIWRELSKLAITNTKFYNAYRMRCYTIAVNDWNKKTKGGGDNS